MVHSSEWCETKSKPTSTMVVKEKKKSTSVKNGREGKGAGSRRIFSPLFKLQVLDSYRQDADCQGNQRATARKYGIHRRQIQKWLQMETNLRLSVQKCNATSAALNLSSGGGGARQPDAAKVASGSNDALVTSSTSCHLPVNDDVRVKSEDNLSRISTANYEQIASSTHIVCADERVGYNASELEEYVNVDEITDSEEDEDVETSSCSSYEKNDKALDFTSATLSKRRFYTTDFKLHVLDAFKNDQTCKGNQRATARKFGIHRRQVQKWLNCETVIKCEQYVSNSSSCSSSSGSSGSHIDDHCTTTCLDLSHKRKLVETTAPFVVEDVIRKRIKIEDTVQESALCLVKNHKLVDSTTAEANHNNYHPIAYPSAVEHSYCNSTMSYLSPEYPFCLYQPWHCCYQQISSTGNCIDSTIPKYSYAFNLKYEASYVDIPVQYGFGDSVPSKWLKENPSFLHGPPSIHIHSSSYK